MGLILKILLYWFIFSGVQCVHQLSWLPCQFIDENVWVNVENHTETHHIHRKAMLQFGQRGDAPVDPYAVTFLVIGSRLDLHRYVEGVEMEQLECEVRRYSTQGIEERWPSQGAQEYNNWFSCSLRHTKGQFVVMGFLRHVSTQPPLAQLDYLSWPAIGDRDILTTTVALVLQTETPTVKTRLASKQNLHCHFAVDHKGAAVTVEWYQQRHGERTKLFSYASRSGDTQGTGVRLKGIADGNASFMLPSIKMSDEGTYICSVSVIPLFAHQDVTLSIQEPPRVSLSVAPTLTLQEGEEQKAVCLAEGYYPLDVEIEWFKEDPAGSGQRVGATLPKKLENVLLSSHKHNQDKTLSVSAFIYLKASLADSGKKYICAVSHRSLRMPIKKSFILIVEEPTAWMYYLTGGFVVVTAFVILFRMLSYLHSVHKESKKRKPY
ncbi:tapasin-related protein [Thalassophryne amazonica]|uniref:tapasin-related protein n=1 Tax=Thalassophryne amazonica TaxID=390379 RepID=UPI001470A8CD|nr:tapasin-related protein [Thalassophryne amazonica]